MISRLLAAVAMTLVTSAHASAADPENTLILELEDGPVTIELLPDLAPGHVERIKKLTREGFYDGVVFHRVIPGFMAQTGDPTGTGMGSSDYPDLKAEFNKTPHTRGAVSMARAQNPNSANSQFFIVFDNATFLDGQYTVFGRVIDGMDHVDALNAGTQANNGAVANPDKIVRAHIAADK
ncbi:peptidylprolyl isomerase [Acuticoccus sp. I52.16.1]|uniref:peptidylprolyl isomerase n=1 Tax=Acuticoccus sp. I52.16.1 TaxID=2928472 RepID=UPI001FCFDC7E|nr:peptidylprolyl isomerase [Acuticoccus sp. I52.16.1]UOM33929.1 peptidylprolyl isomerase [Acuticoccus sp. I52.16.1]